MIVDGPLTFDLTVGADRRIPQDGDAQTFIPPVVSPVVLSLKPTTIDNGSGVLISSSACSDVALSIPPATAASFTAVHILAPGLWELEMSLSTNFNFAFVPGTPNGAGIELLDAVIGTRTAVLFRSAQVGGFVDYNRIRILTVKQLSVRLFFGATIAAQNIDMRGMINFIKIL